MAPKRRKTGEKQPKIVDFFKKENKFPGSSCNSPVNKPESQGEHLHSFEVIFTKGGPKYNVECTHPCTVLEAIQSHLTEEFSNNIKVSDEHIIIKMGEQDNSPIVATHFPCCCVKDGERLVIYTSKKVVQAPNKERPQIFPPERYSIFFIDKEGGRQTRSKSNEIFRCTDLRQVQFGCYCVYGEKEMTVEEAIEQDGRFNDNLRSFTLSDKNKAQTITKCTAKIAGLNQKEFKICLSSETKMKAKNPKQMSYEPKKQPETACSSNASQEESKIQSVLKVAQQKNISLKEAMQEPGSGVNIEEVYELLRQQFPHLKELMESKFPGGSYQKQLKLRKENFGKIQQAFSEVHRIKKLFEMGKSVCKIIVENVWGGTGFVLFGNFILTNVHLFKGCMEGNKLKEYINVHALFNYEEPEPNTNFLHFIVKSLIDSDDELDYAVLELKPEEQKANDQSVPAGLLKKFGPKPENGEACIIGHPAGGVKRIDPTCIIEPEKREQAIRDHLAPYKDTMIIVQIINQIKDQGIDDIRVGGNKEHVSTYNTYMYHGASGSPVFDAHGQLFGLHTAGFGYGYPKMINSVIEFAQPLLTIFEKFVCNLKESGNTQMLDRVKEAVADNDKLTEILKVEPMEVE